MESNFDFFKSQIDLERFLYAIPADQARVMGLSYLGASHDVLFKPDLGEYGIPTLIAAGYSRQKGAEYGHMNFYIHEAVLGNITTQHIIDAAKHRTGLYHYLKEGKPLKKTITNIRVIFIGTGMDDEAYYFPFMNEINGMHFYLFDNKDEDICFFQQFQPKMNGDCFPSGLKSDMDKLVAKILKQQKNG